MNKPSRRGCISPWQLFALLTVIRVTDALGKRNTLMHGVLASDTLFSLLLAGLLTLLLSLPFYVCLKQKKNPLENGVTAGIYMLYFVLWQAFGIAAFLRFSVSEAHPEAGAVVVAVMASAACAYAASLGIEAVGRFASFCLLLLIPVAAVAVIGNLKNVQWLNYYPLIKNSRATVLENALLLASDSGEIVLAAVLAPRVNGNTAKAYYAAVGTSYGVLMLLFSVCIGVTGYAAEAYDYPLYSLFKMASFGSLTRLDAVHTAFRILSFFLKGSTAVYCTAIAWKPLKHMPKCLVAAAVSGAAALALSLLADAVSDGAAMFFRLASLLMLQVLIPIAYLIFQRKGKAVRA